MLRAIHLGGLPDIRLHNFEDVDPFTVSASLSSMAKYDPKKVAQVIRFILSDEAQLTPYGQLELIGWKFLIQLARHKDTHKEITFRMIEELLERCFLEASNNISMFQFYTLRIIQVLNIIKDMNETRIYPRLLFRVTALKQVIAAKDWMLLDRFFCFFTSATKEHPCLRESCRLVYTLLAGSAVPAWIVSLFTQEFNDDSALYTGKKEAITAFHYRVLSRWQSKEQATIVVDQACLVSFELLILPEIRLEKWARELALRLLSPDLRSRYNQLCALVDGD